VLQSDSTPIGLLFSLGRFGQTRRNSIHKTVFPNIMTELTYFFRSFQKNFVHDRKKTAIDQRSQQVKCA